MSNEHRFNEQEIAAIFKQAAAAQEAAQHKLAHSEGLTLAELQQIGAEAGITPAFIRQAAAVVQRKEAAPPPPTLLGFPIGVARTVDLPGPLSDENWERLVVDLRETFQASGKVWRDGSLRQWSNGNLQILVEPTDAGHRLRLRTRSGRSQSALTSGAFSIAMSLFLLVVMAAKGDLVGWAAILPSIFLGMMGVGMLGYGAVHVTQWSRLRAQQMDALAARAVALATPPAAEVAPPAPAPLNTPDLDEAEGRDAAPVRSTRRTRS